MIRASLAATFLLAVAGAGAALLTAQADQAPDTVIVNGRIFTGASPKWAEALSIKAGRIIAVGATATIKATATARTRVIDASGRLVVPGVNDAHTHPGTRPPHVALDGPQPPEHDPTLDEILGRLKTAIAAAPAGRWVIGEIGGAVLLDPNATRFTLDPISPSHPVMLVAWHGHGTLFNTAALKALGVRESEADPPGGRFLRMPDGRTLTGMAQEYAEYRLRQKITAQPDDQAQIRGYQQFARECVSYGITSVQAFTTNLPTARAASLIARADLPLRVRLIDFPMESPTSWWGLARSPSAPLLTISGVKYIVDGTPIERLMFLREPYSDAPRTRGRLNFTAEEIRRFLPATASARMQPMFHATGDAAIDAVLDTLDAIPMIRQEGNREDNLGSDHWQALRPRLEHADMFEPSHVERAKRLGIVVVQNPSHFMIPAIMKARLGERVQRVQTVKSIVRAGVPFAIGSDGPLNPFLNIMFAVAHPGNPSEALTVEEAFRAYTHGSAFAEMMETQKGTLETGKVADLAILSQNIFEIPPPQLPKTVSVLTMVGGRVVHGQR